MKSKPNPMRRKPLKRMRLSFVVAVILGYRLLVTGPAQAAPQGGVVTSGSATISQAGAVTTINQATNKASINWQSFSTKPTETVNFNQPSASSITLNRVIGNEKSVLQGALNATGRVFLINSNGVLMTRGSTVNTAGFVASTLNMTDDDFNASTYVFRANGSAGSVINLGTITAREGGYAALLGNSVSNQGVITATKGTVSLNSGNRITLNFNGDSLVSVSIDEGTLNALVENKQAIYADGGSVIMTAKAADDLLSAQVNNSGIIQARTIGDLKGSIELYAQGGTTRVDGTLDASAPTSGDGGSIETSGDHVKIADSAVITTKSVNGTTGSWLIDSDGFTIGANGDMTGALLSSLLGNSNITLSSTIGKGTDGDIDVNQAVTWSADTTLTLNATNDININKSITATGANAGLTLTAGTDINVNAPVTLSGANAALAMNYGGNYHILTPASYSGTTTDANGNLVANTDTSGGVYGSITLSGSNASLSMNGTAYTLIHDMSQLDLLDGYNSVTGTGTAATLSGHYALAQNLDASGTTYTSALVTTLGGTFAGLGHAISNLTVTAPSTNYVGLIGKTLGGATVVIRDIGLEKVKIAGKTGVGALLAYSYGGTISQAYSTGTLSATSVAGGLVGITGTGATNISDSYSEVTITATNGGNVGGLVGSITNGTISNCHTSGIITAKSTGTSGTYNNIGGLIGVSTKTTVSDSYAKGDVNAATYFLSVGGLIGAITDASNTTVSVPVTDSFATGKVIGGACVGGLIGSATGSATKMVTVDRAYATGAVTGTGTPSTNNGYAGGLIGLAKYVAISHSHATGYVNTTITDKSFNCLGGLVGSLATGSITDSYATGNVSGATYNGNALSIGVGGLVGSQSGTITNSYATGRVTGYSNVGGLVGGGSGTISDSWASGAVSGNNVIGGLAGIFSPGTITRSSASGNVQGFTITNPTTGVIQESSQVGGFIGNSTNTTIVASKATGSVTGGDMVGGFFGKMANSSISDSYATGKVTGTSDSVGGFGGKTVRDDGQSNTLTNNYWNRNSTGRNNAIGTGGENTTITNLTGLTSAQFKDIQHYRDGTIDQVFSERAAASSQASRTMGRSQQDQADQTTLSTNLTEQQQPSLDNHIVYADSADYSADIKAINADGVEFDLEDKSQDKKI